MSNSENPVVRPLWFEVLWRCDGCGFEQLTPRDDPPARCSRCQGQSVFWVKSGDDES